MSDFDQWISEVSRWRDATANIPLLVREDIQKGKYKPQPPTGGFRSYFDDPLAIQYSMGYKDRKYSLTYDVLKQVVQNLSLLSSIINTRVNQISSFAVPFRISKSLGYVVKHKDPGKLTTKGEREMIKDLERFIYNCGADKPNPHTPHLKRDDFETFLKKIVRDSLTYDQVCAEIVPARNGTPYEFVAVDASTIRIWQDKNEFLEGDHWQKRKIPDLHPASRQNPFSTMQSFDTGELPPAYVQVINGQLRTAYNREQLAFGVRNPRTDIYQNGYGYSEIEQLITIITSHLYAEEYNRRFFMQGSAPKGMIVFKGDAMDTTQLEGFRREWRANVEGTANSWKTPIFQSEQGVDWIAMATSNRDMEYGQWLEYLIKITTGVFLIDPAELNFDLAGGVQQTPLFESSSEWKLKASRDRGLKPLLRFFAKFINDNIIAKIDDHFTFDFVGLDELTEQEKHELRKEQVASYMTLNEIRRAEDLPDVDGGDMILNPTYIQALQVRSQMEAAEQAQAGGQGGQAPQQGQQQTGMGEDEDQDKDNPQYADQFTKSLNKQVPVLEIDIDDSWINLLQ